MYAVLLAVVQRLHEPQAVRLDVQWQDAMLQHLDHRVEFCSYRRLLGSRERSGSQAR